MIDLAGLIITSNIANIDNKRLVSLVKRVRPKAMWYYKTFSECIEKYSYNEILYTFYNVSINSCL